MKIQFSAVFLLLVFPLSSFALIPLSEPVQAGAAQLVGRQTTTVSKTATTTQGPSDPTAFKTGIKTETVTESQQVVIDQAVVNMQNVGPSITPYWNSLDLMPDMAAPVTLRQLRELMIYESNLVTGECACPYSPDRVGGRCGTRAVYYMPHSCKVYCFPSDISNNAVHFFWLNNALPCEPPGCYEPNRGSCAR